MPSSSLLPMDYSSEFSASSHIRYPFVHLLHTTPWFASTLFHCPESTYHCHYSAGPCWCCDSFPLLLSHYRRKASFCPLDDVDSRQQLPQWQAVRQQLS